jgi:hypothetical protein
MNKKVEEQKGPIHCAEPTYRTMKYSQKVMERAEQLDMLRGAQTLTLHQPKTEKK